ncbi:SipW-dependent-type signal peptide-containing protein [Candidatus Saccharibacteria bacterium]|nr:SipW-dependent-type signal peptide-containing protein [Candidatus Saccharibacteria bacterium]
MKKKVFALSLALGALALILSAGTMAYFTDTTSAVKNTFTVGSVDITLDETEIDPTTNKFKEGAGRVSANTYESVMPGTVVDKDPTVTNVGKSDAYVRVKMTFPGNSYWQQDMNDAMALFSGVEDDVDDYTFPTSVTADKLNKVFLGFDASKWDAAQTKYSMFGPNGFQFEYEWTFTYKGTLAPEETATLFDGVKIADSIERITDFDIELIAEAVQADGFDTAEAAFAATFDAE